MTKITIESDYRDLPKKKMEKIVAKWQKYLKLTEYEIAVVEKLIRQKELLADHYLVAKDGKLILASENPQLYIDTVRNRNFLKILIFLFIENWKEFTITQFEDSILHELLHVAYPDKIGTIGGKPVIENEFWIENKARQLLGLPSVEQEIAKLKKVEEIEKFLLAIGVFEKTEDDMVKINPRVMELFEEALNEIMEKSEKVPDLERKEIIDLAMTRAFSLYTMEKGFSKTVTKEQVQDYIRIGMVMGKVLRTMINL